MGAARRLASALALALALSAPGAAAGDEPAPVRGPAYLVYAGPYSSSPSSAFGHLFLVLAARPGDPPPLWDVHTFNAVTFDVGPLRYLTVGIAGGFLGRFERFAFHQKTREYEQLEDRDLWLLELRLDAPRRAALEAVLARAEGRWYPYSFFQRNCAHYLQDALAEATAAVPRPSGVVSPAEVFGIARRSALAGGVHHRPSASRRIEGLARAARPDVRARLRSADWTDAAADAEWLSSLRPPERLLAQEVFGLRALGETSPLPTAARDGLARLRLLGAEPAAIEPALAPATGPGHPVPPPRFHGYPRLQLLYAARGGDGSAGRIHLGFRAAMHDETDPWVGQQPASTMELLGLELSSAVDRPDVRVESAVLFAQRALAPSSLGRRRTSWLLEALARRGGLLGPAVPHGELRAGIGKTVRLPGEAYLHGLATLAAVGAPGEGAALAPGLEAGIVARASRALRLGGAWRREHDLLDWSRSVQHVRLWTRLDLGASWGLLASADSGPGPWRLGLGVVRFL